MHLTPVQVLTHFSTRSAGALPEMPRNVSSAGLPPPPRRPQLLYQATNRLIAAHDHLVLDFDSLADAAHLTSLQHKLPFVHVDSAPKQPPPAAAKWRGARARR